MVPEFAVTITADGVYYLDSYNPDPEKKEQLGALKIGSYEDFMRLVRMVHKEARYRAHVEGSMLLELPVEQLRAGRKFQLEWGIDELPMLKPIQW